MFIFNAIKPVKKMSKFKFILCLIIVPFVIVSQNKKTADTFEEGYVIGLKGDTIHGQIKTSKTKPTDFYLKINFKDKSNKIRLYTPDKIAGYWFKDFYYASAFHNNKPCFFKVLSKGKATLLEISFYYNDAGEVVEMQDYCVLEKDKPEEMIVLDQKGLKKQLKNIFKSDKDLSHKISEQKEIPLNEESIQPYFTEFNGH